ncbi:MAG: hypothetical protein ACI4QT_09075 [Kiritimatiellia bacterium]
MGRLASFDYTSPYYYMVTLKRLKGLAAFSEIGPDGLVENGITRTFTAIINGFHEKWRCCEEISPFVIMPDHLHLLIKIRDIPERVALGVLVSQLAKALRNAYWQIVAADAATGKTPGFAGCAPGCASAQPRGQSRETPPRPIFEPEWHDWIVKKSGQLAAFRRYIKENAARAWTRRAHARYFGRVSEANFLGRRWFAYGNRAILDLPVLTPFKGHRATAEGSPDWQAMIEAASRIGPGGAGVSTFMSPLEKACGNAIAKAGGKFIVLSPEGFGPRWHPPLEKEKFCAQGRMLLLSLYEAAARQPTRQELYERCHEMIDLARAGLTPSDESSTR